MQSRYTNLFRIFFAFTDLFALNLVHLCLLIFMEQVIPNDNSSKYLVLFIVNNLMWLICAYSSAVYLSDGMLNFDQFAKRTFHAFIFFLLGVLFFLFLYEFDYSRLFILIIIGGFGLILLISRGLFISLAVLVRDKVHYKKKIVILGDNDLSRKLANSFLRFRNTVKFEGYFDDLTSTHKNNGHPVLGPISECVNYSIDNHISEIYSTVSPESNQQIYELAHAAEKNFIRFKFVPDLQMFVNRNIYLDYVEDIPIISLRSEPMADMAGQIKKRFLDIGVSLFMTVFVLSWLIPIMALAIKLDSRGPVFFRQLRSGKNNRSFWCYKFRSLKVNNDADTVQVTRGDKRFTRLGKFLRKSNLDELPQFINVLLGQMSLVGPRPHMLKHTDEYSKLLDEYMIRHYAKPGITGWAQIHGYRGEISQDIHLRKRIEFDIWYMENWNIWLDVRIIFLTAGLTVKGDKNAF